MAPDTAGGVKVSFTEATKLSKLDSHTYKINLSSSFCTGVVPNGGYAASCMLAAANDYLSERNRTHTLTAHFEYPSRTAIGPAIVVIEDVKLSGLVSILHLTLWQGALLSQAPWIDTATSRRTVLAYTTHVDLRASTGVSLPTGYEATPAAALPPLPSFDRLKTNDADDRWQKSVLPKSARALASSLQNWGFYMPRGEPQTPGVLDMWIRMASGERITQAALPYLVDSFPFDMHTFLVSPEQRALFASFSSSEPSSSPSSPATERSKGEAGTGGAPKRAGLWFPTVVMNLEVKTALPEEGVDWLTMRITSKQIKDGRFDLDVLVRDLNGELVALSHHVAMIVSLERNTREKKL